MNNNLQKATKFDTSSAEPISFVPFQMALMKL